MKGSVVMNEESKKKLLDQIKTKCYISTDEPEVITRITNIFNNAIPKINEKLGIKNKNFDYSIPSEENDLFANYCLYAWNNKTNEFDENYLNDIMQIRSKYEVEQYFEKEQEFSQNV